MIKELQIEAGWRAALDPYIESDDFQKLADFVRSEYQTKTVYPKPVDVFKAFSLTPLSSVKVVILGQDPYHGSGQAHGLSFSVPHGVPLPPSLKNIYKEIESDLNIKKDFDNGDLESWETHGLFVLNAILSVVAGEPASHQKHGWEEFTDTVIKTISDTQEYVVFMLWGNFARSKKSLIDPAKHLVLEAPYPSPFSAHSGFFGSKHFSQCNTCLKEHGEKEIEW